MLTLRGGPDGDGVSQREEVGEGMLYVMKGTSQEIVRRGGSPGKCKAHGIENCQSCQHP